MEWKSGVAHGPHHTQPRTTPRPESRSLALEDAANDLLREVKTYAEPEFLVAMEKIGKLHEHMDRLMEYAEEVKVGRMTRSKAE